MCFYILICNHFFQITLSPFINLVNEFFVNNDIQKCLGLLIKSRKSCFLILSWFSLSEQHTQTLPCNEIYKIWYIHSFYNYNAAISPSVCNVFQSLAQTVKYISNLDRRHIFHLLKTDAVCLPCVFHALRHCVPLRLIRRLYSPFLIVHIMCIHFVCPLMCSVTHTSLFCLHGCWRFWVHPLLSSSEYTPCFRLKFRIWWVQMCPTQPTMGLTDMQTWIVTY